MFISRYLILIFVFLLYTYLPLLTVQLYTLKTQIFKNKVFMSISNHSKMYVTLTLTIYADIRFITNSPWLRSINLH